MTGGGSDVREEAAMWWSRMRGPGAEEARADFERWRAASPLHAAEFAALERTWDLAAGLGATGLGRARSLSPGARPLAWTTAPRLALAVAAMIAIVLTVTLWPSAPAGLQPVAVAHATGIGEVRTLTLPDGSSVTMDTDSRIAVLFDGKVRKVRLERGRARFDVRSDPSRAFVVEAGGTAFSGADSRFDVGFAPEGLCASAYRGALEVRPVIAGSGGASLRLQAGRTIRLNPRGAPLGPSIPAGKGSDQWVSGMLVYQAAPLSQVIAETNRYSSRHIVLDNPALGALRVTGAFRPVPAQELAAALAAAFNLQVRDRPDGTLVLAYR
ncbi:MAG: FecR domain-containing protein [Sphingomonas sp.]